MRKLLIETDYNISSPSYDDDIPEETSKGCAGTDHPWYRKGDFYLSASFDDEDAHPFAYFPGDPKTGALEFFISDDYFYDDYDDGGIVHNDLFGEALTQYIDTFIRQTFGPVEDKFCDKIIDFYDFAQDNGLEPGGAVLGYHSVLVFQKEDGSNRVVFKDIVSKIFNELGINIPVCESLARIIYNVFDSADWDLGSFCNDFRDELFEYRDMRDMGDQQGVADLLDLNANDLFDDGRLEGRIWTDKGIITFYPGQQPSRDEMRQVIEDISKHLGVSEEELLKYYTIFETGSKEAYTGNGYRIHPDATINCCTVADYIEGKYSGFNRKEEIEMVKNRKGAARNIHLANQKDKFNFFKNFRKTRDNAVYVPREKGAGTLAAYHAMRYPFSESRMITELEGPSNSTNYNYSSLSDDYGTQTDYDYSDDYSYSNDFEAGTDFPLFYDEKRGKEFGGDWHSPNAYPFAYFEVAPGQLEFFIGEGCSTHSHLAFNVAKDYYLPNETSDKLMELAKSVVVEINKLIEPAINGDKEKYNWLKNNLDEASNIVSNSSLINDYDIDDALITIKSHIKSDIRISLLNNVLRGQNDVKHLKHEFYKSILENCYEGNYDDDVRVWWLNPLFQFTDLMDGDEYFENGRMEGRIFTHENAKTISFYDEQQPNSEELDKIIKNLVEKTGISYDEFMEYEIIYRNWDETYEDEDGYDMGRVTGCSVYEYITGKPMDEFINPEERKGSQFIPHLASPEEKFNFFKGFRDARDKAIYAPREKAAGTLAAYHAMRYPYGEVRDITGKLLTEEHYNQAGTDFPCFYDEKNDEWYEARWDCNYGFPFGYWPIDDYGNEEFFCANPYDTHAQACGLGAEKYFYSKFEDIAGELADDIMTYFMAMVDYFKDYEFYYDEINDEYISEELNETKSVSDWADMIMDNIYSSFDDIYDYVLQLVTDWLEDDITPTSEDIKDDIINHIEGNYHFDTRDEIDEALEIVGSDFDSYFESGHSEGRIWPHDEMIGFYETEQPNPESLKCILYDLSDYMGKPFEYFMNFFIIFEDPRNNWEVTGCTIENYLSGNYGPNTDEEDDGEEEIQYARDGKTVFVPHLASPEEKFDYFKAFRDTRDKAVYVPREKGAGEEGGHTLAGYHAMRYPYGESRNIKGKLIKEDYAKDNEAGTDSPYYSDPDTGFVIEGDYDDNDACSFAYFPYKLGSDELKFICCMDADGPLHRDLLMSIMSDIVYGIVNDLTDKEDDIIACLKEYKYNIPNKDDFRDILADIFEEVGVNFNPTHEFANHLYKYLSMSNWSDDVLDYGLFKNLCNEIDDYWSMRSDEPEANVAMAFGVDYGEMLYAGRLEGRIWTDKGLITFYPGQQPSRDEMKYVLKDISENIGIDYNDLLNFYTIFETGSKAPYTGTGYRIHDDAIIQCCTVADYIEGRYSGFNRKDEFEMVKNRKGVENLNIHLAKPEEKFNFFKGFRDARDKAIYVPREKGAGSLAAYHAMRYPYSEGRERLLQMIDEEIEMLISESTNSKKAHNRTRALIANKLGLDANDNRVIKLESDFERAYFGEGMRTDWFIVLEPLLCSFALELGYGVNNNANDDRLKELKDYVFRKASISENKGEYINYIKKNITTYEQFEDFVDKQIEEDEKEENDRLNKQKFSRNNEYSIIGPVDYATANKYGNYSNPNGKLCYTQSENTWNNYTKNGLNACYILLKNGWEEIKAVHDDKNSGYDNYGLSMIFVFVDENGKLAYCNTRWNHDAKYALGCSVDHAMTPTQISDLIGANFNEVFLPKRTMKYSARKITDLLNSGKRPEDIFENIIKTSREYDGYPIFEVTYLGKKNLLVNNRIVSPNVWFNSINYDSFRRSGIGYGYIKSGDSKGVFFDINGNIINETELTRIVEERLKTSSPDEVFDGIRDCSLITQTGEIDYNIVNVAGVYNYLMNNGKILSPDMWLLYAQNFNSDGLALVKTNLYRDHYDYMDINRNIITYANYANSLAEKVKESNGELLNEIFRVWEEKNGYYVVSLNMDSYNVLDSNFNVVFPQHWFKRSSKINPKNNTILFSKPETNSSEYAICGYLKTGEVVDLSEHIDRMSQYIANGGNPNDIFEEVGETYEGKTVVKDATLGKNYITKNGILCEKWYVEAYPFKENFGIVSVHNGWFNYVNENGEELLNENVDYAENFNSGKAIIGKLVENEDDDEYNEDEMSYFVIDTNGNNLIDEEYFEILDDVKSGNPGSIIGTKLFSRGVLELVVLKNGELMECDNTWQDNTEEGMYPHYEYYAATLVNEGKAKPEEVFDEIFEQDNHYVVKNGRRYNFMTKDFKIPYPKVWPNYVSPQYNDGWRKVTLGYYGGNYINDNLEYMIPMETKDDLLNTFREVNDFSEGLAVVKFRLNKSNYYSDDKEKANYGYIDTTGKPAFDDLFASAKPFYNGKASVVYWTGENYVYRSIDREGNIIK